MRAHLLATYGARAADVLAEIDDAPELARRIDPELPYLWAEVVHAARAEHALEVADALARRVPLLRDARDQGLGAVEHAADLMARVLDWSPERRARSVERYRAAVVVRAGATSRRRRTPSCSPPAASRGRCASGWQPAADRQVRPQSPLKKFAPLCSRAVCYLVTAPEGVRIF